MKNCRLCLNVTFPKNSIAFESPQECGATVEEIVKQHFWFSDKINQACDMIVCKNCWSRLEDFHEFYCAVKFHYNINDEEPETTKTEALDDALMDSEAVVLMDCAKEDEAAETLEVIEMEDDDGVYEFKDILPESESDSREFLILNTTKTKKPTPESQPKKRSTRISPEDQELMLQHAEMKCEKCSHKISNWSDALSHYKSKHSVLGFIRCCGRKVSRVCEMVDHMAWHRDKTIFTCPTCGKVMLTRENLQIHEGIHIPEDLRQYSCNICSKKFGTMFSLTVHKRHHRNDSLPATIPCPLKCSEKLFKTDEQLKFHMDHVHNANGPYMCEICSKQLKSKYSLEIHVKAHINPDPPIECKTCGHFLKNKRRYLIHMSRHKQAETGPYQCPQCSKLYKHKDALQDHINYVHTARKLPCEICGKVFKHDLNLREHMSQHTGAEPYRCPFCEKTFKSNANMHSHKKKKHPEEYAKLPPLSYMVPLNATSEKNDE